MVDYPSFRIGTAHEETPRNGTSYCLTCGNVSDLQPTSLAARIWHGDSFNIDLTDDEVCELEERAEGMSIAELTAERCPRCDSLNLLHHNRISSCSDCRHTWEW